MDSTSTFLIQAGDKETVEDFSGNEISENKKILNFDNLETFDEELDEKLIGSEKFVDNKKWDKIETMSEDNSVCSPNPISLSRDICVNDILANSGTPTNPEAEVFCPESSKTTDLGRDICVNSILANSGASFNPEAEVFAISEQLSRKLDLNRDILVNDILANSATPTNPDTEVFCADPELSRTNDLSGDICVNEILANSGSFINPETEVFDGNPEFSRKSDTNRSNNQKNVLGSVLDQYRS